jgi:hypothetical protein
MHVFLYISNIYQHKKGFPNLNPLKTVCALNDSDEVVYATELS